MKMLTLARISTRNIYLNLFGGAYFHWRSLKVCSLAKRTCLNYVWTAIFPWSYFSLKFQILCLFRARSFKTVECRFTLKRQKQPREVFCKKRCSWKFRKTHRKAPPPEPFFLKKETVTQIFSCEFSEISKNAFFTEYLLMTASCVVRVRVWFRISVRIRAEAKFSSGEIFLEPWHNNNNIQLLL